jgi:SAM-dependent methyltransferase
MEVQDASGQPAVLVRCRGCGLVQAAALPAPEELFAYYARYSYEGAAAWEVSAATDASLAALVRRLERYRREGRVLDVGCGAGAILRAFRRAGWSAEGTELSPVAAERLRKEGFVVHVGTLDSLGGLGVYDVAVLSETLEHVRDPRGLLAAVPRLLRPGGALYLTTPHVDSLSRRLLGAGWRPIAVPEHLFYFNRRSLRRLLESVGLRPVEVWTDGINPFEILARGRRAPGGAGAAGQRADALREAAVRSRGVALAKSSVNTLLRVFALGDTLKAIAERG